MRSFDIDDRIKMIGGEIQFLRIAYAKINVERAVCLAIQINGFRVLVNGGV